MLFTGRKIDCDFGVELPDYFEALPQKLDKDTLDILIRRVRASDHDAITVVIKHHARLAVKIATQYAAVIPSKSDDLVSAALLGLTTAVNWIAAGRCPHDNIVGYIIVTIHRFCSEFIEYDSQVRIPRDAVKTYGIDIAEHLASFEHNNDILDIDETDTHVRECIALAISNSFEDFVIRKREEGYTDAEIANMCGCSRQTIQLLRQDIYKRFLHYYNEQI